MICTARRVPLRPRRARWTGMRSAKSVSRRRRGRRGARRRRAAARGPRSSVSSTCGRPRRARSRRRRPTARLTRRGGARVARRRSSSRRRERGGDGRDRARRARAARSSRTGRRGAPRSSATASARAPAATCTVSSCGVDVAQLRASSSARSNHTDRELPRASVSKKRRDDHQVDVGQLAVARRGSGRPPSRRSSAASTQRQLGASAACACRCGRVVDRAADRAVGDLRERVGPRELVDVDDLELDRRAVLGDQARGRRVRQKVSSARRDAALLVGRELRRAREVDGAQPARRARPVRCSPSTGRLPSLAALEERLDLVWRRGTPLMRPPPPAGQPEQSCCSVPAGLADGDEAVVDARRGRAALAAARGGGARRHAERARAAARTAASLRAPMSCPLPPNCEHLRAADEDGLQARRARAPSGSSARSSSAGTARSANLRRLRRIGPAATRAA